MSRTFEDKPAVREKTPLLIGLVSPSGAGKTYSALRLATGIQRVTGGDIHVIDTEAKRALHYADQFRFRHTPFVAPFGPLDYLAAVRHCVSKGAGVVVVDSQSHEHEGPGGVLEMHEAEVQRLSRGDTGRADSVKMLAWSRPKQERREFINAILQMPVNFIFCFRAKEKLKIEKGQQPRPLGWMPIAAEEFIFEMTLNALLLPGANGHPCWQSGYDGERATMKLPGQFRHLFEKDVQLSEDIGQQLAEWAAGKPTPAGDLANEYATCFDADRLKKLEEKRAGLWKTLTKPEQARLKSASETAAKRVEDAKAGRTSDPSTGEPGELFTNDTGAVPSH